MYPKWRVIKYNNCFLISTGRTIHFGNETGVSLEGIVVLSTSEVRNQWLKVSVLLMRVIIGHENMFENHLWGR